MNKILTGIALSVMTISASAQIQTPFTGVIRDVQTINGPSVSRQECEEQYVPSQRYNQQSNNDVGGQIVGGIVGGLLGNQIGGGNGRAAATGAGAIAGTIIGGNVQSNSYQQQPQSRTVCRNNYYPTSEYIITVVVRNELYKFRTRNAYQQGDRVRVLITTQLQE